MLDYLAFMVEPVIKLRISNLLLKAFLCFSFASLAQFCFMEALSTHFFIDLS